MDACLVQLRTQSVVSTLLLASLASRQPSSAARIVSPNGIVRLELNRSVHPAESLSWGDRLSKPHEVILDGGPAVQTVEHLRNGSSPCLATEIAVVAAGWYFPYVLHYGFLKLLLQGQSLWRFGMCTGSVGQMRSRIPRLIDPPATWNGGRVHDGLLTVTLKLDRGIRR